MDHGITSCAECLVGDVLSGAEREGARRNPPGTLGSLPYGRVVTDRKSDHTPTPRKLVAATR